MSDSLDAAMDEFGDAMLGHFLAMQRGDVERCAKEASRYDAYRAAVRKAAREMGEGGAIEEVRRAGTLPFGDVDLPIVVLNGLASPGDRVRVVKVEP